MVEKLVIKDYISSHLIHLLTDIVYLTTFLRGMTEKCPAVMYESMVKCCVIMVDEKHTDSDVQY